MSKYSKSFVFAYLCLAGKKLLRTEVPQFIPLLAESDKPFRNGFALRLTLWLEELFNIDSGSDLR